MKVKNYVLALTLILTLSSLSFFGQSSTVNTETSTIHWLGKKITGQHEGNINVKSGTLEMNNEQIVSGNIVIDMNSITCTDLEDEGYNAKLVGHLKSDDFFGVETFPTATLEITGARKSVDGKSTVTGLLTIKGISETINFEVMKTDTGYTAMIEIDRTKFDVKYGSSSFFDSLGDRAIDNIFTLNINLIIK